MDAAYSAGAHASLFGYIAREVMQRHPEDGEGVLEKAVIQYGHERGARMRQRALTDGLPLNMSTYLLYREYPVDPAEFQGPECHEPNGDFHSTPTKCPWSTKWKERGLSRYCGVYCRHVDRALAEGFDAGCVIDSLANLTEGAAHCELYFRGVNIADAAVTEKMRTWGPRIKQSAALKGWDYQLAHTYASFEASLKEHYPANEVQTILQKALECFEGEYGAGSAREFMALTNQDFASTAEYTGA